MGKRGTLKFSYIHRLGSFFFGGGGGGGGGGVQHFEFQYFWGLSLMNIFLVSDFVDIFWGVITKLEYI